MQDVEHFESCQKILCCDGFCDIAPPGFTTVSIERKHGEYNWANVWNKGVELSKFDVIWYLDCDRIVPKQYITMAYPFVNKNCSAYSLNVYRVNKVVDVATLKKLRNNPQGGMTYCERRMSVPPNLEESEPGKNPFSGNVMFSKKMYIESGGLDADFEGYGYADSDFYIKLHKAGHKFYQVPLNELHQWHDAEYESNRLRLMLLFNGMKLCRKWGLKPHKNLTGSMHFFSLKPEDLVYDNFSDFEKNSSSI